MMMRNWDKYKRMQCNINKALINEAVTNLTIKNYSTLYKELVKTEEDRDVFNDTYLKLTYKYNPDKDFQDQFKWIFKQLKGAYYRDNRANHFYNLNEDRLIIPDILKDEEAVKDKSVNLITKLKSICQL